MVASVLRVSFFAFFSLLCAFSVSAAETACSLQTLEGTYVFSARGWSKLEQRGYRPIAYIGLMSYDGKGKILGKFRAENDKATQIVKGTYTLGKNCEAEVTLKNGRKATYFVNPTGETFSFVVTSGVVASGDAHRVTKEALVNEPSPPTKAKTKAKKT